MVRVMQAEFQMALVLGMYEIGAIWEAPLMTGILRSAQGMVQPPEGCPHWLVTLE